MKPDTKILCRVGSKLRDYKVIEVWQWTEDRLEEKADRYIRADIVKNLVELVEELWKWEMGFDIDCEENQEFYGDHPLMKALQNIKEYEL